MDREAVIRMAQEAGFDPHDMSDDFTCNLIDIERFAALVSKHEREVCAKVCENKNTLIEWPTYAAAIRARGNT